MNYSHFNTELLDIMEQGRMRPNLKMVTLNPIKHKAVGSNGPPLNQNLWSVPTCITEEDEEVEEDVDCNTSGMLIPMVPLLPSMSRTGRDTTTGRLPAILTCLSPYLQVRLLCQRGTTRLWHTWSGLAFGKRWRQAYWKLLLTMCLRPVYMFIKASITRRNSVLETVEKGKLWRPNFMTLTESRI